MARRRFLDGDIVWRQPDGEPVSCEEKIVVLNENREDIRQECQDAFEDAILMGCDETQVREVLASTRQGIKDFSNWPTVPQLYVKGEFIGGCDIVREMFQDGELQTLLQKDGAAA